RLAEARGRDDAEEVLPRGRPCATAADEPDDGADLQRCRQRRHSGPAGLRRALGRLSSRPPSSCTLSQSGRIFRRPLCSFRLIGLGRSMNQPVLSIQDLSVEFSTREGAVKAVNHVYLELHPGEIVAIVGESGCGKTTLALSLLQLLPQQGKVTGGVVSFGERNLLQLAD